MTARQTSRPAAPERLLDMITVNRRRHGSIDTSLGTLLVVLEDQALAGLYFPGHWYPPQADRIGPETTEADDPALARVAAQLREYLAGTRQTFDLPLISQGDDFSEQVWTLLNAIPYGETTTYGALAERLGNRALAQRVGQAVGHNPISIVVPCHRVVGSDGSLTGYAGGLDRKRTLLELEEPDKRRASRLF